MKIWQNCFGGILVSALLIASSVHGAVPESLARESGLALGRGVQYLLERQAENGAWAGEPAVTALAMQALYHNRNEMNSQEIDPALARGREFILGAVQPNGAFAGVAAPYLNYTTSVCLTALALLDRPEDQEAMRNARRFLWSLQLREAHPEHPTEPDSPFYGGIGYGSGGPTVPDISNTKFALEALYMTDHLDRDTEFADEARTVWRRALDYLRSVQAIPDDADEGWTVNREEAPEFNGGFVYRPDQCRVRDGKVWPEFEGEPIPYGAATVCGLTGLLYAGVERDDPRVRAAMDWIRQEYTLDENPVIGIEGHFYYLWTFAKGMQLHDQDTLELADGTQRHWRRDLLNKLLELQQPEGQWFNQASGRYMESVPELTTAYAMIAMQIALE